MEDITARIDRLLVEKTWGKVENPGVLEVPEGKDVQEMSVEHFKKLAKSKGVGTVVKALMNLYRWNKNSNPGLSSWAKGMQEKISAMKED